mmetsp:Transcript_33616/g.73153  ORF Transcript_33616/g.73153 Transcript_33616/m.73153 type:complete len:96 (-) Transcript_33616:411-698(-)
MITVMQVSDFNALWDRSCALRCERQNASVHFVYTGTKILLEFHTSLNYGLALLRNMHAGDYRPWQWWQDASSCHGSEYVPGLVLDRRRAHKQKEC